jgi:hypothetical protein
MPHSVGVKNAPQRWKIKDFQEHCKRSSEYYSPQFETSWVFGNKTPRRPYQKLGYAYHHADDHIQTCSFIAISETDEKDTMYQCSNT